MRLYSRTGQTALSDPEAGQFTAGEDFGFDLPENLFEQLRTFPQWETEVERQQRLVAEEIERRKDPATLLAAVEQIMKLAQGNAAPQPAPEPPAAPPTAARPPAKAKAAAAAE